MGTPPPGTSYKQYRCDSTGTRVCACVVKQYKTRDWAARDFLIALATLVIASLARIYSPIPCTRSGHTKTLALAS